MSTVTPIVSLFKNIEKMNIICDVDEIIVNQTPKWCKKIFEYSKTDKEFANEIKVCKELLDPNIVLARDKYYLNEWLKNDNLESISQENFKKMMDLCFEDKNFYDDLVPTKMGLALNGLCNTDRVEKIYFITKNAKNGNWDSKLRFLERYFFVDGKTEIIRVPLNKSKSEYINKYVKDKDRVNVLLDDEPNNIKDILANSLSNNTLVVLFPIHCGYSLARNTTVEELEEYEKNGKEIRYYLEPVE